MTSAHAGHETDLELQHPHNVGITSPQPTTPSTEAMPSLIVVVFVIEAAVHLINAIGAATINNLASQPAAPPTHPTVYQMLILFPAV